MCWTNCEQSLTISTHNRCDRDSPIKHQNRNFILVRCDKNDRCCCCCCRSSWRMRGQNITKTRSVLAHRFLRACFLTVYAMYFTLLVKNIYISKHKTSEITLKYFWPKSTGADFSMTLSPWTVFWIICRTMYHSVNKKTDLHLSCQWHDYMRAKISTHNSHNNYICFNYNSQHKLYTGTAWTALRSPFNPAWNQIMC